jgi:hypothetical protein
MSFTRPDTHPAPHRAQLPIVTAAPKKAIIARQHLRTKSGRFPTVFLGTVLDTSTVKQPGNAQDGKLLQRDGGRCRIDTRSLS